MTLHPEIPSKNGKKQFAVLPYEEFVALQEWLVDMEDLLELRKAKRAEGKNAQFPCARRSGGWVSPDGRRDLPLAFAILLGTKDAGAANHR